MRIILDATGGDTPDVNLKGAIDALLAYEDITVVLAGPQDQLLDAINQMEATTRDRIGKRMEVLDAPEIITTDEHPVMALRQRPRSPFVLAANQLRNHEADAFVSAGSTGAFMASGLFYARCVPGVARPALGAMIPVPGRPLLLVDSGANVDCKPEWLHQFALMGSIYMKEVQQVSAPQVGLLNIGVEEVKGNELTQAVYKLLREEKQIVFAGNIEARDAIAGSCDVLVADGFAGNILIKNIEGTTSVLFGLIKKGLMSSLAGKIGALLCRGAFRNIKRSFDSSEVGGAPLLGVGGVMIKAHGNADAKTITSAIRQARTMVTADVVGKIRAGTAREA